MAESSSRVLVVDDYEHWRRFACSTLQERVESRLLAFLSTASFCAPNRRDCRFERIARDMCTRVVGHSHNQGPNRLLDKNPSRHRTQLLSSDGLAGDTINDSVIHH